MSPDKFTNVYRLPGSIQVRIAKWQATFRGTSDLVLHKALSERNKQYRNNDFLPKGWCLVPFTEEEISITHHGRYIQTTILTMIDRKVAYKRIYLSRMPLEEAEQRLKAFKLEWMRKYNRVVKRYNQIKKKEFINLAREELETLYPSIPKGTFDKTLWNKLVHSELGAPKKFSNPYYVKKADV
ncbi:MULTISPECIES: MSHA operon transcriptional regulator [Vibrio]|uniref:Uncharacterized protein n=2 Tax=Vibrio TaxID=662 RepID=A0A7X4LNX3_9VIBR|nr:MULTISPECIES: hypothetical protein [Vibrio]MBF9000423.1 hypothetical protein [Vibrio nitrifigilis]MZI95414.1 hypothetical protein [Vibrio eleionomae]